MSTRNALKSQLRVSSPAPSLLANLRQELVRYLPFSKMAKDAVDFFLLESSQHYFAPGEVLVEPSNGIVQTLYFIRQGKVSSKLPRADLPVNAFQFEPGDLFPVSAVLTQRASSRIYEATDDTFALAIPSNSVFALAGKSAVFADFMNRNVLQLLDHSRQALREIYASRVLVEHSLEMRLGELTRKALVQCRPETPLAVALTEVQQQGVGTMLVTDDSGKPLGILSRYDVLSRVTLPELSLHTPIKEVMSQPVLTLSHEHTAQDAALLMSRYGFRHVPITHDGVAIGMVSERDLFAMQRLSIKGISDVIRAAMDVDGLRRAAQDVRLFARSLLSQGVQARQLTELISHLNDVLTERLLYIKATQHGVELCSLCWLALGAEGRSEQTIATDQDNGIILPDGSSEPERAKVLAFALDVNQALNFCGFPLCQGDIMAGNPECCLTLGQWRARFAHWIENGSPQDLLNASIFFDFRPLVGDLALAQVLREEITRAVTRLPRFLSQLTQNALTRSVPLNWVGGIEADHAGLVNLKLQGTAIFVDAARIYALALGVAATGTRDRLEAVGRRLGLAAKEYEAWSTGFEFLQILRLNIQLEGDGLNGHPNHLIVSKLNHIDRRILKETLRVARSLQQRLELDYQR